jgi:hypothetical protein
MINGPIAVFIAGTLGLCLIAIGYDIGALTGKIQGSVAMLIGALLALFLGFHRMVTSHLLVLAVIAATALAVVSVLASDGSGTDAVTTLRYIWVTPLTCFVVGYFLSAVDGRLARLAIVLSAIIGIAVMVIALGRPATGELLPELNVGERGRFYSHPFNTDLVWPVTVAETCAAGFVCIWLGFTAKQKLGAVFCYLLGTCAVAVSLVGATRTYVFAVVATATAMLIIDGVRQPQLLLRLAVVIAAIGIVLFASLGLNDEFRDLASVRLDRFSETGLFDTTGRNLIWSERWELAQETSWFHGRSMPEYWSTLDVSSHMLVLDFVLLGGWGYALVVSIGLMLGAVRGLQIIAATSWQSEARVWALAFLTLLATSFVSSTVISSLFAYSVMWFVLGCMFGASEVTQDHERADVIASAGAARLA